MVEIMTKKEALDELEELIEHQKAKKVLAGKLDCHVNTIEKWFTEQRFPKEEYHQGLMETLRCTVGYIVEDNQQKEGKEVLKLDDYRKMIDVLERANGIQEERILELKQRLAVFESADKNNFR